jgi:DNA-binding transcriptional ArsR family regulator
MNRALAQTQRVVSPQLDVVPADVFKALSDPIRWDILQQMAAVDELPCSVLEETLPVSKPTISYHTKILIQAGLVTVRKQGRNLYYVLRRETLREIVDEVWAIAGEPKTPTRRRKPALTRGEPKPERPTKREGDVVLLTW